MVDENTAALNKHEREQDRRERLLPASEVARKRVELLDEAIGQVTVGLVMESLTEAEETPLEMLALAVRSRDRDLAGRLVLDLVERYVDRTVIEDRMTRWEQEILYGRRDEE